MMDINQTNYSNRITTEENLYITNSLSNAIKSSRTGELVVGIIVRKKPNKYFLIDYFKIF
jgi:hypothetical protein